MDTETTGVPESTNADEEALAAQLQQARAQLIQSEKMAAIGQLAAGVAHEINNPVGYIGSNLGIMQGYLGDLNQVLDALLAAAAALPEGHGARQALAETLSRIDVDYLRHDLCDLVNESLEGVTRVRQIVQDLKDFSHAGEEHWTWADVHRGLDSTLNIVNNEIKYKAEVVKEYGQLPPIECLASQLNQVFMNLLVNAAHAIDGHGTITLRTGMADNEVWVAISDTGCGIPQEKLAHIFDPFFTTKPVGKGTGLGLALARDIVQKHHGRIEVQSAVGQGTTFTLRLPVQQPGHEDAEHG